MAGIYTKRFFSGVSLVGTPSWTCPDDGNVYVLRDVWWSAAALNVAVASIALFIAGVNVWGAVPASYQFGPGLTWWYWQGRQVVEAGESVELHRFPSTLSADINWIGTGYVLLPTPGPPG